MIFFCSSLEFARKSRRVPYGREDLFFALHLTLGGKLDICGRDDLFFALFLTLGGKCPPFAQQKCIRPCWHGFKLRPTPFKFLGTPLNGNKLSQRNYFSSQAIT